MKKLIWRLWIVAAIALIISHAVIGVRDYADRKACVCSVLTTAEQTFLIDDRLYRICEKDTLKAGTFLLVTTKCDHGRVLHLNVMPDEGKYKGYIVTE